MMQQPLAPQPHAAGTASPAAKKKSLTPMQIVMGVLLVAAAILITLVLALSMMNGQSRGLSSVVKKDKYQAVFLNSQDGQVYFGKLEIYNGEYYRLSDIYYVRVENKIQPEGAQSTEQSQQSISLAKLGNELHGPEDEMFIARDKVLFWENLKEDGQVVKAIREYQKNPDAANQQQQQNNAQQQNTNNTTTP